MTAKEFYNKQVEKYGEDRLETVGYIAKEDVFELMEDYHKSQVGGDQIRHFIVFFTYYTDTKTGKGFEMFTCSDGTYLSWVLAKKGLEERAGTDRVTITNVIELSKRDYEAWIYKPEPECGKSPNGKHPFAS